jgi:ElaB/YqjD/DUF883 family membrane-anchored ribosome-binding protein
MAINGKEQWEDAIEKAKELLEEGRKEMARAKEIAKEKGEDALEEAQEKAREVFAHAKAKGAEFWDDAKSEAKRKYMDAREMGEDTLEDLEKLVRKHPARSIGLTLLVGVVIGALLSRDRD